MKLEELQLGQKVGPSILPLFVLGITFPVSTILWGANYFFQTSTSSSASIEHMTPCRWFISILLPILFTWYGIRKKSLNASGAFVALFVGFFLTISSYCFLSCLMIFFLTSSRATKFRGKEKRKFEEDFKEGGQRNWMQVICNGGMATELGILYLFDVGYGERPIDFVNDYRASWLGCSVLGALSCANGDTWASELGTVIKTNVPRLITTFKKVPVGTNGAITAGGLALGGMAVGLGYYLMMIFAVDSAVLTRSPAQWPIILLGAIGGLLGSSIDSLLGSTLQFSGIDSKGIIREVPGPGIKRISGHCFLDNHSVNLISESTDKDLVSRCIKVFRFEPHPRRKILFILGEVTITIVTPNGKVEWQSTEDFKKPIHLLGLRKSSKSEKLAREILKNCAFIDDSMFAAIVEVVEELKSREYDQNGLAVQKQKAADGSFLPRFPEIFDEFGEEEAITGYDADENEPEFGKLTEYFELLYEDIPQKIEASKNIAKLAKCGSYLKDIALHDSAINSLFRTLREDSKKSSQLSKHILTICLYFARSRDFHFHSLLTKHKIHSLTLDIIDYELERCEKWKTQLINIEASSRSLNECHLMWLRLEELTSLQNGLLKVAFEVLHHVSEIKVIREVLLAQKVVTSLNDTLDRRNYELLEVVVSYLKNLSCYQQFVQQMIAVGIIDKIVAILKEGTPIPKKLVKAILYLLYNLSFSSCQRQKIVDHGLVSILINCFEKPLFQEITAKILYILSMEPSIRTKLAKPSFAESLITSLVCGGNSTPGVYSILTSLAVNISKTNRGAKVFRETNKLRELINRAVTEEDFLLMKIVRNLAEQDVGFLLYEIAGSISEAMVLSENPEFVIECIGTLGMLKMNAVDLEVITQKGRIFPWLKQTLAYYLDNIHKQKKLNVTFNLNLAAIDVLMLLGNICTVEEGARVVAIEGFFDLCLKIVQAELCKETAVTETILYLLKKATEHETISVYLALKTHVPNGLMEIAKSATGKWKESSVSILEQIAKFDDAWKENVQQFHFLSWKDWNKDWVESVKVGQDEDFKERERSAFPDSENDDDMLSSGSEFKDSGVFGMFQHQFEEETGNICEPNDSCNSEGDWRIDDSDNSDGWK